jgi:hypothetical protein
MILHPFLIDSSFLRVYTDPPSSRNRRIDRMQRVYPDPGALTLSHVGELLENSLAVSPRQGAVSPAVVHY